MSQSMNHEQLPEEIATTDSPDAQPNPPEEQGLETTPVEQLGAAALSGSGPAGFRGLDGQLHGTLEALRRANEIYLRDHGGHWY